MKTVYYQGAVSMFGFLAPPYGAKHDKMLDRILGVRG